MCGSPYPAGRSSFRTNAETPPSRAWSASLGVTQRQRSPEPSASPPRRVVRMSRLVPLRENPTGSCRSGRCCAERWAARQSPSRSFGRGMKPVVDGSCDRRVTSFRSFRRWEGEGMRRCGRAGLRPVRLGARPAGALNPLFMGMRLQQPLRWCYAAVLSTRTMAARTLAYSGTEGSSTCHRVHQSPTVPAVPSAAP